VRSFYHNALITVKAELGPFYIRKLILATGNKIKDINGLGIRTVWKCQ
jgi:hypothetical protein